MFVECPHCHTRVLPMQNNICPACRMDMSDTRDVDPGMVSLIVRESDELPPYCYLCNTYTDRYVRIEGDEESPLEKSIRILGSLVAPPKIQETEEGTSNVFIDLPQCESCAELEDPSPLHVDYEYQTMTFLVHTRFKERVQSTQADGRAE